MDGPGGDLTSPKASTIESRLRLRNYQISLILFVEMFECVSIITILEVKLNAVLCVNYQLTL